MNVLPLRLRPGCDLRRELERAVEALPERCGFVLSGIGSLDKAALRFAGAEAATLLAEPLEVLSLAGSVTAEGAHLHASVSTASGQVLGGHVAYGCRVRTTAEVLVAAVPGWRLSRRDDPATGYQELDVTPTDHEPQALQAYYAQRAGEYDRIYAKPERQADLREIERWVADVLRDESVLEVACGTGYWTRFIAPVARAVLAIDAAPETLRIAQTRVAGDHVAFEVGDAYALPRDRGAFTAAFAGFWFSHVPLVRRAEFLRGLDASLQPGARVVLLDNLYVEGSSTPVSEQDAAGDTWQTRRLDDGSTHRVLKNFPSAAELHALVDAGIGSAATYRRWGHYWAFDYRVPTLG